MRRNVVIISIIISAIAVFMIIVGIGGYRNAANAKIWDFTDSGRYDDDIYLYSSIGGFGIILLFVGIPLTLIGLVMKSKEQKKVVQSNRRCPKCGREIPFDAVVCPYCTYDFK